MTKKKIKCFDRENDMETYQRGSGWCELSSGSIDIHSRAALLKF